MKFVCDDFNVVSLYLFRILSLWFK